MLHVLLFFLLGISVFAAPVKTSARVNGPTYLHRAVVQKATHIDVWYPIGAADGVDEGNVSRISLILSHVSGVSHPCHS